MRITKELLLLALTLLLVSTALPGFASAQDQDKQHHEMIARGNSAMGFDAAKTTHHFLLTSSGGTIEVTANDPKDSASRDEIQHHLAHIAQRFKAGDFDTPMLVHDRVPPGVPVMKRLKAAIRYEYAAFDCGARVVISTREPEALAAVHDFLRFQIEEHHTGDATELPHTR